MLLLNVLKEVLTLRKKKRLQTVESQRESIARRKIKFQ